MISSIREKTNINWHLSTIRTNNIREEERRYNIVTERHPDVAEVDSEIKMLSLEAAKARIMSETPDRDASSQTIKDKLDQLIEKKRALLVSYGYPADYLDPIYSCPICKDEGFIDGQVCSCVKRVQIEDLYKNSNLNEILSTENFDTFDLSYYSKECSDDRPSPFDNAEHHLNNAKAFVKNFDNTFDSILMYGAPGLGKTFLTNCIAKELLDSGHSVLYLTSNELFEDIMSKTVLKRDDNAILADAYNFIFTADLLIIDDLGSELMNSFVQSQLFEIINRRILEKRSTIISTNLNLDEIKGRYTDRTLSRLVQHFTFYYFYGKNIRYQKRTAMLSNNN